MTGRVLLCAATLLLGQVVESRDQRLRLAAASPDVALRLNDFGLWFEQHRHDLEALAAAQKPTIDEAARLLAQTATCRAR